MKLNPLNDFTDPTTKAAYEAAVTEVKSDKNMATAKADEARLEGTPRARNFSACVYVALAQSDPAKSECWYHFAGHQFRELGQLQRAAESYENSGIIALNRWIEGGAIPSEMSLRGAARAKSMYSDIGESMKADRAHVLRQRLAIAKLGFWKSIPKQIWGVVSGFGTSLPRWFVSLSVMLLAMTAIYEFLFSLGILHHGSAKIPLVTAFYFTVITSATVGYGDIYPDSVAAQVCVTINVVLSYVLLAAGATFFSRD